MISPAERAADRVVEKFELEPPIDVEALIESQGAELEECEWPYDCDAVATGLGTDGPKIFIKRGAHPLRRRFTLAHELGHLTLGWHLNTIMCDVDPRDVDDQTVLGIYQEREASAFASRLLVPYRFRQKITNLGAGVPEVLAALEAAEVSAAAGIIAISAHLPAGTVLSTSSLERPVFSPGTGPGIKDLARNGEWSELRRQAVLAGRYRHQGQSVKWYSFWAPREPLDDDDPRESKDILRDALGEAGLAGERLAAMRGSLAGIIGAAFRDRSLREPSEMFGLLHQRLATDPRFAALMNIPDFNLFVERKVREVAERRN